MLSNKETGDIMKITKSLEESSVSKTIENQVKKEKGRLLSMSSDTTGAILLGNLWRLSNI